MTNNKFLARDNIIIRFFLYTTRDFSPESAADGRNLPIRRYVRSRRLNWRKKKYTNALSHTYSPLLARLSRTIRRASVTVHSKDDLKHRNNTHNLIDSYFGRHEERKKKLSLYYVTRYIPKNGRTWPSYVTVNPVRRAHPSSRLEEPPRRS